MSDGNVLDENTKRFLGRLLIQTGGGTSAQASMYDVGAGLGMDRETARHTAEMLMGFNLVEIRTLSGGIGLTSEGVAAGKELGSKDKTKPGPTLADSPVVEGELANMVEALMTDLKGQMGSLGLGFESLDEVMADLKTIDAQMRSPRPKTSVIRACFLSAAEVLEAAGAVHAVKKIREMTGRV